MPDAPVNVWVDFLRYHARVTDLLGNELAKETGLPLTWYDVLVQLHNAPDEQLRMQELANAVVLSKSGLTRLVDRLEAAGLVVRRTCPSDRRGTLAAITPAGRARLLDAQPVHRRGIQEHFTAHLTDAQLEVLGNAFATLLDAVRATSSGPACESVDTSDA